jgi:hypothetical protein
LKNYNESVYLGSKINDARCTREIKSRIAMARRRPISPTDGTQI